MNYSQDQQLFDPFLIQSITKPEILIPLLSRFKEFFLRNGINIEQLGDNNRSYEKLSSLLGQIEGEFPDDLINMLRAISELSEESGHDRIMEEAKKRNIRLVDGSEGLSTVELAALVVIKHPEIVESCVKKTEHKRDKRYREYQSTGNKQLSLEIANEKKKVLQRELSSWFESQDLSPVCQIAFFENQEELAFLITHGEPLKTNAIIDLSSAFTHATFRPRGDDWVIYNNRTHILKVSARLKPVEEDFYRRKFGEIFFDDENHFQIKDIYSLKPLSHGKAAIRLVRGIEQIRLTEVLISLGDGYRFTQESKADNLFDVIEQHGKPDLSEGRIVSASFLIKYSSGGKARKLELRPPNFAGYNRERDGNVVEEFLRVNELLVAAAYDYPS